MHETVILGTTVRSWHVIAQGDAHRTHGESLQDFTSSDAAGRREKPNGPLPLVSSVSVTCLGTPCEQFHRAVPHSTQDIFMYKMCVCVATLAAPIPSAKSSQPRDRPASLAVTSFMFLSRSAFPVVVLDLCSHQSTSFKEFTEVWMMWKLALL